MTSRFSLLLATSAATLPLLLATFLGLIASHAASPGDQAHADRLLSHEVVRLELELYRLRIAGSPDAQAIEARLLAGGGCTFDELAPDALRGRVLTRLRGDLANVSGAEHRSRVKSALALGFTAAELGVDDSGPLTEADVETLVGTVLTGPLPAAREASRRLGQVALSPVTASALMAGLHATADDRAGHVAWSLASTPTSEILTGLFALASDASLPTERRQTALAVLLHADREGVHVLSALRLVESDSALQVARGLVQLVGKVPRTALAGPAGIRLAEMVISRKTNRDVRLAAIRRLGASSAASHGEVLLHVLRDGSEDTPVRLAALIALSRDRLKIADPVIIDLLREDPSLEFRRAVAGAYANVGPFPGDAELRAALTALEREVAAATR